MAPACTELTAQQGRQETDMPMQGGKSIDGGKQHKGRVCNLSWSGQEGRAIGGGFMEVTFVLSHEG